MSNYVRTKDEIRKTENLTLVEDERFGRRYLNQYDFPYIPIKEADTIEELCDEFVYINKVGKFDKTYVIRYNIPNHRFTEPAIEEKIEFIKVVYKDELDKIRGAIYTDKGLIYVAKMKDKGELELI